MENASKALLMAAGVLIGVMIIALMVQLFLHAAETSQNYSKSIDSEEIAKFNANFTQYVGEGKKLTISEVITLCNFADSASDERNENVHTVTIQGIFKDAKLRKRMLENAAQAKTMGEKLYKLHCGYDKETGYINSISFEKIS